MGKTKIRINREGLQRTWKVGMKRNNRGKVGCVRVKMIAWDQAEQKIAKQNNIEQQLSKYYLL